MAPMFEKIKLLVLDVDGVMTDGILHYNADGQITKRFHVQDGVGIKLLQEAKIMVAVITAGQDGACVANRMKRLGINDFYEGNVTKEEALRDMKKRYSLDWSEISYIGDDWVDLIPLHLVGTGVAVPNARPEVKAAARYITECEGGNGAVREVAELILKEQGKYEQILSSWATPKLKN